MRARLALAVGGIRCELREVTLRAKPAALLDASAKATVPVLILPEDRVIEESLDIMRWALAQRDPEAWLARDDAALIAANDGAFKQALDRYKYPDRYGVDPLFHRDKGLEFLRWLEARLTAGGQLDGTRRGLTDAAIVPFVRQFAAVDQRWFDAQPVPHLRSWLDDHLKSSLFQAIMMRVKPWSPGDPPIHFPSGRERSLSPRRKTPVETG
jgi:glutathione S-transferase